MNANYQLTSARSGGARGFSLLELLFAMAIITIAMAVSVPSFQVWIDNYRLSGTTSGVLDALQMARSEAVTRNRNVVVGFTSNGWQVFVDDGSGGGTAGNFTRDGSEQILRTVATPPGIVLDEIKFGVGPSYSYTGFNSRGMPINNNCTGTVKGKNTRGKTFTIAMSLAGSVVRQ